MRRVQRAAGSTGEMNLGMTGVAAPKAASSSVARYSRTAGGARRSVGRSPLSWPFLRLASARIMLASTAKPSPPTSPSAMQRRDRRLEQLAQQVAVAEAAMPVLREGRVIGHSPVEAEAAEPAIGEVQVHLLAQPPLRADAHAVADDQHPHHQLGIDRRPAHVAVERPQTARGCRQDRRTGRSPAACDRAAHAPRG